METETQQQGPEEAHQPFRKKKKGRTFLQKAKRFGKQGQRGKGTEIDQDQYDYLVRVLERWRGEWESDEEKAIFVGNVMQSTEDSERQLAGNQLGSRVIEMLLPSAESETVEKFCTALSQDMRLVCLDPFMSHVLEKLLILKSFCKSDAVIKSDNSSEWLLKVCRFVTNNAEDFCHDTYASHLLRTCTECLMGLRAAQTGGNQSRTQGYDERAVWRLAGDQELVKECDEVLEIFTNRLLTLSPDSLVSELCVRVIHVFCSLGVTRHQDHVKKIITHLIQSVLSTGVDLEDNNIVRLSETCVAAGYRLGDKELAGRVYTALVDTREEELCVHPGGNFVIQRLLDNIGDKEEFLELAERLGALLETVLASGCSGVVLSLVKAGRRLGSGQTVILNKLSEALHCAGDSGDSIAPCLVYMRTKESLAGDSPSVHLHGSLILQELLHFSKPIKLVRSLLQLPAPQLSQLLSDPRGCHITDSFMSSSTVGEKSREGLIKSLKGEYVSLACSKHGSRSLDMLWKHSSMKSKHTMVEDLMYKVDVLNSNKFGSFIVKNWFVPEYKRSKADWQKLVEKEDKIAESFSAIIGEKVVTKRKAVDTSVKAGEPEVKKKKEVTDLVDDWLKPDKEAKKEKKKKKAKSYLDDL